MCATSVLGALSAGLSESVAQ